MERKANAGSWGWSDLALSPAAQGAAVDLSQVGAGEVVEDEDPAGVLIGVEVRQAMLLQPVLEVGRRPVLGRGRAGTTNATGRVRPVRSGTPTTAASVTASWIRRQSSTSAGRSHFPPTLRASSPRPT